MFQSGARISEGKVRWISMEIEYSKSIIFQRKEKKYITIYGYIIHLIRAHLHHSISVADEMMSMMMNLLATKTHYWHASRHDATRRIFICIAVIPLQNERLTPQTNEYWHWRRLCAVLLLLMKCSFNLFWQITCRSARIDFIIVCSLAVRFPCNKISIEENTYWTNMNDLNWNGFECHSHSEYVIRDYKTLNKTINICR